MMTISSSCLLFMCYARMVGIYPWNQTRQRNSRELTKLFEQTKRRPVTTQTEKVSFWTLTYRTFLKSIRLVFFIFKEKFKKRWQFNGTIKRIILGCLPEITTEDISCSTMQSLTGIATHIIVNKIQIRNIWTFYSLESFWAWDY